MSVVDYIIMNQKGWDRMEKLTIGDRVESDYQPGGGNKRRGRKRKREVTRKTKGSNTMR